MKISAEGKLVDDKIKAFAEEWAAAKPISGSSSFIGYRFERVSLLVLCRRYEVFSRIGDFKDFRWSPR